MWTCKHCSEEIEDTFDACWWCHYSREGTPPQESITSKQHGLAGDQPESKLGDSPATAPVPKWRNEKTKWLIISLLGSVLFFFWTDLAAFVRQLASPELSKVEVTLTNVQVEMHQYDLRNDLFGDLSVINNNPKAAAVIVVECVTRLKGASSRWKEDVVVDFRDLPPGVKITKQHVLLGSYLRITGEPQTNVSVKQVTLSN